MWSWLVYPFWSKVRVQNREKVVVAEGIIVPGFHTENAIVNNDFSRKIYVTKVSGETIVYIIYHAIPCNESYVSWVPCVIIATTWIPPVTQASCKVLSWFIIINNSLGVCKNVWVDACT
jgi:hypothetical protein